MPHKKGHIRHMRSKKNIINATLEKSVSTMKSTSRKYMPKVKEGLETVGSNVTRSAKKSVPFLQGLTRKLLNLIGIRTRRNRRGRGFVF